MAGTSVKWELQSVMRRALPVVVAMALPVAAHAQKNHSTNGNSGTNTSPVVSTGNNNSNYYNNYQPAYSGVVAFDTSATFGAASAEWRHEQNRQALSALQATQKNSVSLVQLAANADATAHSPRTDKSYSELMDELKKIEKLSHQVVQAETHN